MYDIDYEIYKYIDEQAENYIVFDELLKKNNLTYDEAKHKIKLFKEKFYKLLEKYSISNNNIVRICYDLIECINQHPDNKELQYLYMCIMTDFELLNNINSHNHTEEQQIRNYIRQNELIQELAEFLKYQYESMEKYKKLTKHLEKPINLKDISCEEESDFIYRLTIQHTFLRDSIKNEVYKDNLKSLLIYINSDEKLKSVKPYIIFAILSRRTGMMQNRNHFMPNIKAVFKYQNYNIYKDNGKNFNHYQSELELYDHLKRTYIEDSDINLCDFCFANLSSLSEWYYMYCEPNEDIPMNMQRKILMIMPMSFPVILSDDDYEYLDKDEIEMYHDAEINLKEKMIRTSEIFLRI